MVLLGKGDGSFTAATTIPSDGNPPAAIVVGDFNGDGKADLAVAQNTSNDGALADVLVLLGNGDGTFTESSITFSETSSSAIVVGDFNGDGNLDLAIGNAGSGSLGVLLGHGDGTFDLSATRTAVAFSPAYVAVGDFNGDGSTDFALFGGYTGEVLLTQLTQTAEVSVTGIMPVGVGTHQVVASYPGDATFSPSVSDPLALTVSLTPTTLTLSASPATGSSLGQGVLLTAVLDPTPSSGIGKFVFYNGTVVLGEGTSSAYSGATLTTTSLPPGINTLSAVYVSSGYYLGSSVSNKISYTVASTPLPRISFYVANQTYGNRFVVSATSNSTGALTYSVLSGSATISGSTVTATGVGTLVLQVAQAATSTYSASTQAQYLNVSPATLVVTTNNAARVFGITNPAFTANVTGAVNGDSFAETFSTTATAAGMVGSYPIVPSVTGANLADYTVVASNGVLTVSQVGTATTFALSNQNTTLTANVASLTSGQPTGSVNFYEGQTVVGTGLIVNGVASYTAGALPGGDVVVSAQYSGDANFTESASPPILVLSVAPANGSLTVGQAASVTDTVNLSLAPGYIGTVQLACANLPQAATCSFQPSSVAFTGANGPTSVVVTIQTGVTAQAAMELPLRRSGGWGGIVAATVWMPGLWTMMIAGGGRRQLRLDRRLVLVVLLCGICATLTACGGGSAAAAPSSSTTPAGTYPVQLVVSGSNGLSQNANVQLIVQ